MIHAALDSALAKLKRAKVHSDELWSVMRQWCADDTHSAALEHDPATGAIKCRPIGAPMPDAIPLLFGDAVHNLRAAMDHATFALVDQSVDPTYVKFPYHEARENVVAAFGNPKNPISTISDKAKHIILDEIRPYRDAKDGHPQGNGPFWVVNKLDVLDKHRALILTEAIADIAFLSIETPTCLACNNIQNFKVGNDGQILFGGLIQGPILHADYRVAVDVFINETALVPYQPIAPLVMQLGETVERALKLIREIEV